MRSQSSVFTHINGKLLMRVTHEEPSKRRTDSAITTARSRPSGLNWVISAGPHIFTGSPTAGASADTGPGARNTPYKLLPITETPIPSNALFYNENNLQSAPKRRGGEGREEGWPYDASNPIAVGFLVMCRECQSSCGCGKPQVRCGSNQSISVAGAVRFDGSGGVRGPQITVQAPQVDLGQVQVQLPQPTVRFGAPTLHLGAPEIRFKWVPSPPLRSLRSA